MRQPTRLPRTVRPWRASLAALALAACVSTALLAVKRTPVDAATSPRPAPTRGALAAGRLEGTVTLPNRRAMRTTERYQSSTGESREVQDVPPIVYIVGPVPGATPRSATRLELAQQGEAFRPQLVVVPVGATVSFPNGDPVFHNVFSYSRARRFDLGRYPKGESKTVVFEKPG